MSFEQFPKFRFEHRWPRIDEAERRVVFRPPHEDLDRLKQDAQRIMAGAVPLRPALVHVDERVQLFGVREDEA